MTKYLGIALALITVGCGDPPSNITLGNDTDTIRWKVFSDCRSQAVDLKFFDTTSGGVWPSTTTVWTVKPGDDISQNLKCNSNSRVCYGASVRANYNLYWGVGADYRYTCPDCCYTCGANPPDIHLQPANVGC